MNLILDIGNTRCKAAFFQQDTLIQEGIVELSDPLSLNRFLNGRKPVQCIISSVLKSLPAFIEDFISHQNCIPFNTDTPCPVRNLYTSASTLGSDRLAAVVGAWKRYPGQAAVVIDAGTCIKYNYITENAGYLGGGISPGIDMRFKAMHAFTGRLPEEKADMEFQTLVGTGTRESLLSGVMNGVVQEVEGMINQYLTQYQSPVIVLTGGNAHFFEKRLKNRIFAHPNIVLEGLNEILEYNVRKK
ncbi:MAG: type III pantothenate kinase [Bacteroidia bacterium]